MNKIKRVLKITGISLGGLILLVVLVAMLFVNMSPEFGGASSAEQQKRYAGSGHYKDGQFVNAIPTSLDLGFVKTMGIMYDFFFANIPNREPDALLPLETLDSLEMVNAPNGLERLTWFGHSACLLEINGKKVFFDPMLGDTPAPHPWLGSKRYNPTLPLAIEKLPHLDAVVISHDHYDHLDYGSIVKLKDKVDRFYVPLGVAAHLVRWGVPSGSITELNWWEEHNVDGFTFICTPARHFSGRGLFDGFQTLWASWVIKTSNTSIYFSGDSGYGPHFKEIGEKYGPFDLTMLECGQYNERWTDIHMMPEETVQASADLKSKLLMPIHWGAFTLALHSWTDPVDRVTFTAHKLHIPITTPRLGEPVLLHQAEFPDDEWWK